MILFPLSRLTCHLFYVSIEPILSRRKLHIIYILEEVKGHRAALLENSWVTRKIGRMLQFGCIWGKTMFLLCDSVG